MEEPAGIQEEERAPTDYWGAICFVVLIVTVVYAVMTAA
jgi:hypothetical protein